MSGNEPKIDARPVFRWLAGLSALACLLTAIFLAFPDVLGQQEDPSIAMAVFMLWATAMFAVIAYTGALPKGQATQRQLLLAANKYVSGQMSLEEYGSFTKELLENG